jgi:transposase-like protein
MKKLLATLVTAMLLGAGGLAIASATESPGGSTSAPTTASPPTGTGAGKHGAVRAEMRKLAFETAAKTIGLSPDDLRKAMHGGHSIADVAKSHDVDVQKVVDAVISALDARIQQAVDDGRITSEQATRAKQAVATRVPKFVNATPKQMRRHRFVRAAIHVAAKTIGVSPEELRKAIGSGQSVSEVAKAHDVDPTTVVNALVTAGGARIDKAVASHHLDAARAAKLKARLPQLAQRFVDYTRSSDQQPAAAA